MSTDERRKNLERIRKQRKGKKGWKQYTGTPKQPIRPEEVYAVELLNDLFGIGEFTLREAERSGLKSYWMGKRKYVGGDELIRYLKTTVKQ